MSPKEPPPCRRYQTCWNSVCKFLSCSISFFVGVILIQYQIKHKILVIQWIYLLCCLFVNLRIYFGFLLPNLSIVLQCLFLRIVKFGLVFFSFSAYWICFKFSLCTTCFVPVIVSSFGVLTLNTI